MRPFEAAAGRTAETPRHVPAWVEEAADLPANLTTRIGRAVQVQIEVIHQQIPDSVSTRAAADGVRVSNVLEPSSGC